MARPSINSQQSSAPPLGRILQGRSLECTKPVKQRSTIKEKTPRWRPKWRTWTWPNLSKEAALRIRCSFASLIIKSLSRILLISHKAIQTKQASTRRISWRLPSIRSCHHERVNTMSHTTMASTGSRISSWSYPKAPKALIIKTGKNRLPWLKTTKCRKSNLINKWEIQKNYKKQNRMLKNPVTTNPASKIRMKKLTVSLMSMMKASQLQQNPSQMSRECPKAPLSWSPSMTRTRPSSLRDKMIKTLLFNQII